MVTKRTILYFLFACLTLAGISYYFYSRYTAKKPSVRFSHKEDKKEENPFSHMKDGDIVFQISEFGQGKAIQLATHSKYTHCGIVFEENNNYVVYEAVQPVKKTLLSEWIKDGKNDYYIARRLKNAAEILTPSTISKMKEKYQQLAGKNYDAYFEWSDDRIYCSELVWKLYNDATGIELGQLQKLKEFDMSSPVVQAKLQERYGTNIPYEEMVISPARIFESDLLETVK